MKASEETAYTCEWHSKSFCPTFFWGGISPVRHPLNLGIDFAIF